MTIIFFKKLWEHVKPSLLPTLLVCVLAIFGYNLFKKTKSDLLDNMQKLQEVHDEEMKKVIAAQELERKQREENYNKLQTTLSEVQQKYDDQLKTLEKQKATQVTRLVKQFDSDPTGMANEIGKITGFKVVLPEK